MHVPFLSLADTLLGSTEIELPFWHKRSKQASVQHLLMSLGGSVDCEVCLVDKDELDGGGGGFDREFRSLVWVHFSFIIL